MIEKLATTLYNSMARLDRAAKNPDLVASATETMEAKNSFRAGVKLIQTQDEILKTIIDLKA